MGDQSVQTMVKTLNFSKYFVGSGANSMHTHVVGKSLFKANLKSTLNPGPDACYNLYSKISLKSTLNPGLDACYKLYSKILLKSTLNPGPDACYNLY